ncbi:MAG: 2-isopropylmalate synthase [Saccharofermentanales bacterium]
MENNKTFIKIFDTTLRDGEQAPGCSMNLQEKLEVALALEAMNVDTVEAGFAIASPGDFQSVNEIAKLLKKTKVASLARATTGDIDRAWEALKVAASPIIHTFIATSPIHMEYKLRMTGDQVLERAIQMVKYAKAYCPDVEFSAEDASRSDRKFLCRVLTGVIAAGATTINIPDTVGYSSPLEMADLIGYIINNTDGIEKSVISVHCHNDLGMAVANSLASVKAGARQVECTINGLGERAGNAALEEVVMALKTRGDYFGCDTKIDTKRIYRSSRLVSAVTGTTVQINKAIVGQNAFAHESGIHQHGMMANPLTYEIMTPEDLGIPTKQMILGKHSGRHAFDERLNDLGFNGTQEERDNLFSKFKELADRKKIVHDKDIEVLMGIHLNEEEINGVYKLDRFVVNAGNTITPIASVRLDKQGVLLEQVAAGDGPIYAMFTAINKIIGFKPVLDDYAIQAVTEGQDAQGEVRIRLRYGSEIYKGRAVSTDILESSALAYINAVNQMVDDISKQDPDYQNEGLQNPALKEIL